VDVLVAERSACEQVEEVAVDVGSDGFHEVEGEGVAAALVGVDDPKPRVKSHGEEGDATFGLEDRVLVVKNGADRVCRCAWRSGEQRCALCEGGPVDRHVCCVAGRGGTASERGLAWESRVRTRSGYRGCRKPDTDTVEWVNDGVVG
jgi:hypothetical protein